MLFIIDHNGKQVNAKTLPSSLIFIIDSWEVTLGRNGGPLRRERGPRVKVGWQLWPIVLAWLCQAVIFWLSVLCRADNGFLLEVMYLI